MRWPHEGLVVPAGWRPAPFTEFVVKVAGRCNLACDYCYVYESSDQTWRLQPRLMTEETFIRTCHTISGHIGNIAPSLVFHGGELLLAGAATIERFAAIARRIIGPQVRLRLQTNGTLVTDAFAAACAKQGIRVAVSLDGGHAANDKHRVRRGGTSSFSAVRDGIARLRTQPNVFAGLLCTVDTTNDPVETYESLLAFDPPAIDFLLPHANWATPPPHPGSYAAWLTAVFDRWYQAPARETRIRLFDDIMTLALGGHVTSEAVGLAPIRVAVIETDGTVEQVDALKSAYPGAARLTVPLSPAAKPGRAASRGLAAPHSLAASRNLDAPRSLHAALIDPGIVARQIGAAALADQCLACPVRDVCGGGNYVHRFHPDHGFRHPSVYCTDLLRLITHIADTLRADLTRA